MGREGKERRVGEGGKEEMGGEGRGGEGEESYKKNH